MCIGCCCGVVLVCTGVVFVVDYKAKFADPVARKRQHEDSRDQGRDGNVSSRKFDKERLSSRLPASGTNKMMSAR